MKKLELNDLVMIKDRNYTYSRRVFRVHRIYKNGDLELEFMGGREKGEKISRYGQNEVYHIGFYEEASALPTKSKKRKVKA